MKWISVEDKPPPEDGRYVLCHMLNGHVAFSASFRTFHPNAQGKKTWRDPSGVKVYFSHWMPLPEPPNE